MDCRLLTFLPIQICVYISYLLLCSPLVFTFTPRCSDLYASRPSLSRIVRGTMVIVEFRSRMDSPNLTLLKYPKRWKLITVAVYVLNLWKLYMRPVCLGHMSFKRTGHHFSYNKLFSTASVWVLVFCVSPTRPFCCWNSNRSVFFILCVSATNLQDACHRFPYSYL